MVDDRGCIMITETVEITVIEIKVTVHQVHNSAMVLLSSDPRQCIEFTVRRAQWRSVLRRAVRIDNGLVQSAVGVLRGPADLLSQINLMPAVQSCR